MLKGINQAFIHRDWNLSQTLSERLFMYGLDVQWGQDALFTQAC